MSAFSEAYMNDDIKALLVSSAYAGSYFTAEALVKGIKADKAFMDAIITDASLVDSIRNDEAARAAFNKNRIRLLAPGDVSWVVPEDWPTDFIHVQLVGGGGVGTAASSGGDYAPGGKCGEYKQFTMPVTPGQVITGNIGAPGSAGQAAGDVTFGGVTATAGAGAVQSGAFLVKASDGGTMNGSQGKGGFEGGSAGKGAATNVSTFPVGTGDGSLGTCEGTGGTSKGNRTAGGSGENGAGAGGGGSSQTSGAPGGGGYGGGGGGTRYAHTSYHGGGGSGAIVITCPDGYIPENVVYNTIGGVTAWRRDENIFNDFGENA